MHCGVDININYKQHNIYLLEVYHTNNHVSGV